MQRAKVPDWAHLCSQSGFDAVLSLGMPKTRCGQYCQAAKWEAALLLWLFILDKGQFARAFEHTDRRDHS